MTHELEMAAQARLQEFLATLAGECLRDRRKRESFALYALGLLSQSERKSAEPMAEMFGSDPLSVRNRPGSDAFQSGDARVILSA